MVSREIRTTPKSDRTGTTEKTGRLPRDYRQSAKDINTILDNMTWQQAGDMGKRAMSAGWDAIKSGGATALEALSTPPDLYDATRGLGTGLRQGTEAFAALPGVAGELEDTLRDALAQRIGLSPEHSQMVRDAVDSLYPTMALAHNWPDIGSWSQRVIGDYYEPKTALGRVTRFGGSMTDPSIAMPGGALFKSLRRLF